MEKLQKVIDLTKKDLIKLYDKVWFDLEGHLEELNLSNQEVIPEI